MQEVRLVEHLAAGECDAFGQGVEQPRLRALAGPSTTRDNDTYRASPEGLISPRGTTATHRQERIAASAPPTARGRTELALCRTMRDALLRRSEEAALTWADLERADDGSGRLTIRRAKGDQEGRGAVVYIGTEALAALEAIPPGEAGPDAPVFASPREPGRALSESAIARAIDRAARRAGLGAGFAGHSPRIGMTLDLSRAAMATHAIQQAGRWASPALVVRYTRSESAGRGAVAAFYGVQR